MTASGQQRRLPPVIAEAGRAPKSGHPQLARARPGRADIA